MLETEAVIEERIRFRNGQEELTGILGYPSVSQPQRAVLFCSPHPHFAGDMDNNIIRYLAQRLARESVTLRFDYRGVGDSTIELPRGVSVIDYWDAVETDRDYDDAIWDVETARAKLQEITGNIPLAVMGYSFGVVTAGRFALTCPAVRCLIGISPPWTRIDFSFLRACRLPCLLLCSTNDFLYDRQEVERVQAIASEWVTVELLESGDHFFRGEEEIIGEPAMDFLHLAMPAKGD